MPPKMKKLDDGIARPKRLRDYPRYYLEKARGFFFRLFYIIGLVWEAAPFMLICMAVLCLLDGTLPVIGAYISKDILNEVAALIGKVTKSGDLMNDLIYQLRPMILLFVAYFIYNFVHRILGRLNSMVTAISGERVSNHIKMKIINKARDVDLGSFDNPEFYEKLENANREAGMRPLHILSATFNVISALISAVSFVAVLATLSPIAPILIICAAIPGAMVNYVYRNRNFKYMRRHSRERREMSYYSGLMVNKDMAKEIKILGLGNTFIKKYERVFKKYYKGLRSLIIKEGITQLIVAFFSVLVASLVFRQEKLIPKKILACVLGFAGIIIINLKGLEFTMNWGDLFVIFSAICLAFSSVLIKKFSKYEDPVVISGYQFIIGGIFLALLGLILGGSLDLSSLKGDLILVYLSFLSAIAYALWGILLKHNPVSRVSVFSFTTPIFGTLLSLLMLPESSGVEVVNLIITLILVASGILLLNYQKRKKNI